MVKAHEPPTLQDAFRRALALESSAFPRSRPSTLPPPRANIATPFQRRDTFQRGGSAFQRNQPMGRPTPHTTRGPPSPHDGRKLDDERNELRRKNLCFSYKKPWVPGHRCLGKGQIHYIEVISDDEASDDENEPSNECTMEDFTNEGTVTPNTITNTGNLATLNSANQFYTIKVPRKILGEKVITLIDGGATHNFIDEEFVARKKLKLELFAGFNVATGNGNLVPCNKYVTNLKIEFDGHSIEEDFYVFPLGGSTSNSVGSTMAVSLG